MSPANAANYTKIKQILPGSQVLEDGTLQFRDLIQRTDYRTVRLPKRSPRLVKNKVQQILIEATSNSNSKKNLTPKMMNFLLSKVGTNVSDMGSGVSNKLLNSQQLARNLPSLQTIIHQTNMAEIVRKQAVQGSLNIKNQNVLFIQSIDSTSASASIFIFLVRTSRVGLGLVFIVFSSRQLLLSNILKLSGAGLPVFIQKGLEKFGLKILEKVLSSAEKENTQAKTQDKSGPDMNWETILRYCPYLVVLGGLYQFFRPSEEKVKHKNPVNLLDYILPKKRTRINRFFVNISENATQYAFVILVVVLIYTNRKAILRMLKNADQLTILLQHAFDKSFDTINRQQEAVQAAYKDSADRSSNWAKNFYDSNLATNERDLMSSGAKDIVIRQQA